MVKDVSKVGEDVGKDGRGACKAVVKVRKNNGKVGKGVGQVGKDLVR